MLLLKTGLSLILILTHLVLILVSKEILANIVEAVPPRFSYSFWWLNCVLFSVVIEIVILVGAAVAHFSLLLIVIVLSRVCSLILTVVLLVSVIVVTDTIVEGI